MSEIADILDRAAARVARGWGQLPATYHAEKRPCIAVAVQLEAETLGLSGPCEDTTECLRVAGFRTMCEAMRWNDAPERTQAEVVAKLREAAAKARGQS